MTSTKSLAESNNSTVSNVVPFRPAGHNPPDLDARPFRSWGAQTRRSGVNAVELEPLECRLARRVERVLAALLYHAVLEPDDLRAARTVSIEKRVSQLISRERLLAVARAAICQGLTADLTRLAAAVIAFELDAQSHGWNKLLLQFSARRRQIRNDTLAIADLLAWELDTLRFRPIDQFAKFL
ncbi:hypothetical protein [Dyella flagellata]|uniref:Uncharacterized protein n=1 Tax=Dyella flagellata TaxID=1867833 RepID=A0ABQ5XDM7_9GAMM|nr:hypothetical protein [Dyella flagellata]GLQ89786.1 hypothetical protein GCM10007898_33610 [Dyella flagellata]